MTEGCGSVALVRHEHVPGGAGHAFVRVLGTDTTHNWLQNANAIVAFATCPLADSNLVFGIHAGFCATYMGGADMIADRLRDLMERHRHAGSADWPLWITGHSLGGALAQLSAYDLHRRGFPVSGLMTFASPRAFNALMAPYVERAGFVRDVGRRRRGQCRQFASRRVDLRTVTLATKHTAKLRAW